MSKSYRDRIRMASVSDSEKLTFFRNRDHPSNNYEPGLQFEIEIALIVAEESIPLRNQIRELRQRAEAAEKERASILAEILANADDSPENTLMNLDVFLDKHFPEG